MPIRQCGETWPYLEQFTPALAMNHEEHLSCLPLHQSMDVRLEKMEKDYIKLSIAPPASLFRPKGAWQGGLLATLVDTAAGQALRTTPKSDHDGRDRPPRCEILPARRS
jgi:acyl-coenzyme A thioesterase PaaI-like protein